jgi:putative selenium metabolism hydrolase
VIGESSDLNIVFGGRGRAEFKLTTHGTPSHASTPELGDNAIHKMTAVIREVEKIAVPNESIVGPGVMALTDIISDPHPGHSVIPSGCRATYERRLVLGETLELVTADLRAACQAAGAADTTIELAPLHYESYTGWTWSQKKWFPAWAFAEDHPLVATALQAMRGIGMSPEPRAYQFCTNAAYSAGEAEIPTIGLGPSSESLAHTTDEYIELDQLTGAVEAYRAVAQAVLSE